MMKNLLSKEYDLIEGVKPCLRSDNGDDFVDCLRSHFNLERSLNLGVASTFCMLELLSLICKHRASNCARALLQGKTGIFLDSLHANIFIDINHPLDQAKHGLPPLHLAAQNLSFGLTEAFLMAGADPNLCCHDDDDDDDIANLPVSLAVEALSCNQYVTQWSVEKSVTKLIYILCLKELKEPLDTIRLLASRTTTDCLHDLSLQYAEKGQVVQLTVLLLAAWNKLVTPYVEMHQCAVEQCPIGRCIMKELQLMSSPQEMPAQCTSHLVKLQSAWKMFKLLESKYHQIDKFLLHKSELVDDACSIVKEIENHEVPFVVARDTGAGGPEDVNCDDIPCLMPRLNQKQKDWLDRALKTYSGSPAVFTVRSRKGFAATTLLSRSFHTCSNPHLTNDKGRLTLTTKVEKPAFRQFLPTARTCAYLFSMAKRSFK